MADRDAEEEFEFLVNLLASDGVESDAAGSRREGGAGLGIEKGPDGKLDLGQVKAFYERKKKEEGKEKGEGVGVGWVDGRLSTKYGRNRSGLCIDSALLAVLSSYGAAAHAPVHVVERSRG